METNRQKIKRLPPPPDGAVVLWVLYDHPKDYPTEWVVRRWFVYQDRVEVEKECIHHPERRLVTGALPACSVQVGPSDGDDPVIAEVWA